MDIVNIVNTILANGTTEYQSRVPLATRTNIAAVANPILEYQSTQNEFLTALVNKVAFTAVKGMIFENPLSMLKKGNKPLGLDIENVAVNPATAEVYSENGSSLLTTKKPDVKAEYFRLNRKDQYAVTIYKNQLRQAFTSWEDMGKLVDEITNTLYSGDFIDEFVLMKNTIASGINDDKLLTVGLSANVTDAASANALITAIKTAASAFTYPSTQYNAFKKMNPAATPLTTWSPKDRQILLIRSDILNLIDVYSLAAAYNMDKVTFLGRVFEVDNFGSSRALAVLADESILQVWDDTTEMSEFYNPKSLCWTYFWNHWQTYGLSVLSNAVAFMPPDITLTAFDAIDDIAGGAAGDSIFADAAAVIASLPTHAFAQPSGIPIPITTWVDTDTFDPDIAGDYTFTGTVGTLPDGVTNSSNLKPVIDIVITAAT